MLGGVLLVRCWRWALALFESVIFVVLARIVRCGPVPRHVALIMDGNRRWALKRHMEIKAGHASGYETLTTTLNTCKDLGIEHVTVYAFSIDNFKRPRKEVHDLMLLATEKLEHLRAEFYRGVVKPSYAFPEMKGHLSLLPGDLRKAVQDSLDDGIEARATGTVKLSFCVSYTSTDEICRTMGYATLAVEEGILAREDVSICLLDEAMIEPPDLLIRTSGEIRLSDFLLWQSSFALLSFAAPYWPDFSRLRLVWEALKYQVFIPRLKRRQRLGQELEGQLEARYSHTREQGLHDFAKFCSTCEREQLKGTDPFAKRRLHRRDAGMAPEPSKTNHKRVPLRASRRKSMRRVGE